MTDDAKANKGTDKDETKASVEKQAITILSEIDHLSSFAATLKLPHSSWKSFETICDEFCSDLNWENYFNDRTENKITLKVTGQDDEFTGQGLGLSKKPEYTVSDASPTTDCNDKYPLLLHGHDYTHDNTCNYENKSIAEVTQVSSFYFCYL